LRRLAVLAALLATLAVPARALQPAPAPPPATEGFVPVTDLPPEEQLPAAPLVIGGYIFMWLAVVAYVGLLWRRLGAVQKDLDALNRTSPR
jgi:hypothetical protein